MTHNPPQTFPRSLALLLLLITSLSANHAGTMLSPVEVTENTLGTYSQTNRVTKMLDQSGLATRFNSNSTDFDAYFNSGQDTTANPASTNTWKSLATFDLPLTGYLEFDLGKNYTVDQIAIWNVSLEDVDVELRFDPLDEGTPCGSFLLHNYLSKTTNCPADILALTEPTAGRYLRLNINSSYTLPPPNQSFAFATIGEIAVSVLPPPPPALRVETDFFGDVHITFQGILQSSNSTDGEFTDVEGNPTSPYTIFYEDQLTNTLFRAVER
ncbi:MAG: hypothetical protein RI897_1044 [Verrucomicrobiota bacterium]|jgi:hypothetical protein